MKTLLVMRHAKSTWDNPSWSDFERPLNERGRQAAPAAGRWLLSQPLVPDLIVASTAARAAETAQLVAAEFKAAGYQPAIDFRGLLYHAPAAVWIENLRTLADERSTLCVGHNPGLEELVMRLTGVSIVMKTAAIARIELPLTDWAELAGSVRGELRELRIPETSDD